MLGLCKRAIHTRIYIVKNERYISIEKKIKKLKFNDTPVSENPDPQGNLVDPPENFGDFSEETQEKFLASLGPELQDLFHKGATGQIDEAEISKYMRNMSPEEIQRITDSPIFAQFLGSDSRFNIPSKLDPDVPLSRYNKLD